ncbi:MAG: GNAT family N-acetyltransferase [Alphaproteobacteria bacterium]
MIVPVAHPLSAGDSEIVARTRRLVLRQWRDEDLAPFAALNADPQVCRFLPGVLDRAESDAMAQRIRQAIERDGFGLWAVGRDTRETRERRADAGFIGFVGLSPVTFEAPFAPAVEIGWRLASSAWNQGFATEAALAARDLAFGAFGLDEIVSFTVPANRPSRRVMEKIGLQRDEAGDFDHPRLPPGHPLRPHVLYRLSRHD